MKSNKRKETMRQVQVICMNITLLLCCSLFVHAQDERVADSLKLEYYGSSGDNLQLLLDITINETNPDSLLKYASILIELSETQVNHAMLVNGYLQRGNGRRLTGNFDLALESYFKSIEIALEHNYKEGIGKLYVAIADTYSENGNSQNAALYYDRGIAMLRELKDSFSLAKALINAGDEYYNAGILDSALLYTRESEVIFKILKSPVGQAYSLGNMGMVFAKMGQDNKAEQNIQSAVLLLEELAYYYPISVYLGVMSDIYLEKSDRAQALEYAHQSLQLANKHSLKEQIGEANLKLSEIYNTKGDHHNAYIHYREHVKFKDSVQNIESVQNMYNLRTDFEVSQKQVEVDLLNEQKKNQQIIRLALSIILGLGLIILLTLWWYYRAIAKEKKTSEDLLLNILPAQTAEELKEHGKVVAQHFESTSVLFTDFKGFTALSEQLSPKELVADLHTCFSEFDRICEKYGIEKIKTIGDAYMAAGGLPSPNTTHAQDVVKATLEMAEVVEKTKAEKTAAQQPFFEVRIGVHTGPVVAGIVGVKKFQYDIWGDTVNTASRMESSGDVGKVNISEATYELLKDNSDFTFINRGKIAAKGKGEMEMYFVENKIGNNTDNT